MSNWKFIVEKEQARVNILPPGWDSRDKVAADLGCSPDRVRQYMAPLIKARTVEMRVFPVFDKLLKKTVRVMAYREVKKG